MKKLLFQTTFLVFGVVFLSVFQYLRYGKLIPISYQSEGLLVAFVFVLCGLISLVLRLYSKSQLIISSVIALDVVGVYGVKLLASHIFKDNMFLVSLFIGLIVGIYVYVLRKQHLILDVLGR